MKKGLIFATKLLLFTLVYFSIFYYPLQRILTLIDQSDNLTLQLIAFLALFLSFIGLTLKKIRKTLFTKTIGTISMLWIGYSFILFSILLVFEIINLVIEIDFIIIGIILFTLSMIITGYGIYNAFTLHPKNIAIRSSKVKKNYKIAQITDVHIGSRTPWFLEKVVKKVKEIKPDFLVITGDLIDVGGITKEHLHSLSTLSMPIFYVSGNHERYVDLEKIYKNLKANKVIVLKNETKKFEDIQIIGIEDGNDKDTMEKSLSNIITDDSKFTLLLYHKPDGFDYSVKRKIDLKLAGHTHNGQIFPLNYLVKLEFKQVQGLFEKEGSYSYVSPGTGTWGPTIRLGSKNEISVFHIVKH